MFEKEVQSDWVVGKQRMLHHKVWESSKLGRRQGGIQQIRKLALWRATNVDSENGKLPRLVRNFIRSL